MPSVCPARSPRCSSRIGASTPLVSFLTFAGFAGHFLIVTYVVMQVLAGDIAPDIRRAGACLLLMLALAVPVFIFDRLTATNYMFLNYPSPGSPLEWFFVPWPSGLYPRLLPAHRRRVGGDICTVCVCRAKGQTEYIKSGGPNSFSPPKTGLWDKDMSLISCGDQLDKL